jgi:hypothetical protein
MDAALRTEESLSINAQQRRLVVHPQLLAWCGAALRHTWRDWHATPTLTTGQLTHLPNDATYEHHLGTMKPEWQRHVEAGEAKIIETRPDGNCFFNSASIQLTGSETSHSLLRLHTAIELLTT